MASYVTTRDAEWATVKCGECKLTHKLLKHKMQSIYQCPYCDKVIKLTSVLIDKAVESAKGG